MNPISITLCFLVVLTACSSVDFYIRLPSWDDRPGFQLDDYTLNASHRNERIVLYINPYNLTLENAELKFSYCQNLTYEVVCDNTCQALLMISSPKADILPHKQYFFNTTIENRGLAPGIYNCNLTLYSGDIIYDTQNMFIELR
jgi:hypothetical protein